MLPAPFRTHLIIVRMATANPPLPLPEPPIPSPPSFWSRESVSLKQGIKTGLAGTIAYSIYAGWHLHQGYWAVFAALVVTQANLGASWKAALYRTVGSTCGAISAALLIPLLGRGPVGIGIVLLLLESLFGYLTTLHSAFTAAGFTAALILVFGGQGDARVEPGLVPSLPALAEKTALVFPSLAAAVRSPGIPLDSTNLDAAIRDLDADLARLRAQRTTAPFALDRMLPFWALVFNLRELAQDLKQLESALPLLA